MFSRKFSDTIRKKKRLIVSSIITLILVLGIGYASFYSDFSIQGLLAVSSAWDVHLENVNVVNGSATATAPATDGRTTKVMPYTVNFTVPGEFYEFTVDIVNGGKIPAMVDSVTNKVYASDGETEIDLPSYLTLKVEYDGGMPIVENQLLEGESSETVRVRIEVNSDAQVSDLPSNGINFKFSIEYVKADNDAVSINTERWDGTTEAITMDGDICRIYNTKQLSWLAEEVNSGNSFEGKTCYLMNDLNLGASFDSEGNLLDNDSHEWVPIGDTQEQSYKGDFDGQNHTIYNLYVNASTTDSDQNFKGLFGVFAGDRLTDLTLENSFISGYNRLGVVGGSFYKTDDMIISNVKSINNKFKGNALVGGIIGQYYNNTGSGTISLSDCYSNSNIEGRSTNGGIAGGVVGEGVVENNINEGNIIGSNAAIGGILGNDLSNGILRILNNINKGLVQGEVKWIGGIVGTHGYYSTSYSIYDGNKNYGEIKTTKGAFRVGGILGNGNPRTLYYNNINYGSIDGLGDGTSTSYGVGGIVGTIGGFSWLYNCHNRGNVKGGQSAGGIIGNTYKEVTLSNAINNVINEGSVESTTGYAGGIIGSYDSITSTEYSTDLIKSAYNKGTVKGVNAAGLVGRNVGIKDSITVGQLQGTNNFGVIANAPAEVNISNVFYPNTYTSNYGTAIDINTLNDTTLSNILGNGFSINNGDVKLYKANPVVEGGEVTGCTYSDEVIE